MIVFTEREQEVATFLANGRAFRLEGSIHTAVHCEQTAEKKARTFWGKESSDRIMAAWEGTFDESKGMALKTIRKNRV